MAVKAFKIATMAAAVFGALAVSEGLAAADTFKTACRGNDCVRVQCDDRGRDCFRLGYTDRRTLPAGTPYEETDAYEEPRDSFFGLPADPDNDYDPYPGFFGADHYTFDPDNDFDEYPGLSSHYTNHFDPDNDFDSYPGWKP
jgi:hypothetical protein